ncbi:uracil-DNA glycosylase [Clostridium sp. cel8]|jgi:uracil-DNA glycosylase|uniref:uracil-DNA glycosylase n=1 Tax=Clostridium sp. cel8 TaxID=2663123 RepID=UPI0015F65D94|nr:uracil-DNA glycosylase [Clostridium sp. cel8]MBA5852038.1 uracil-DNA glycosylase [Clostridium sp. cel8]
MDINKYLEEKIKLICNSYTDSSIGGYITGNGPIPCNILFVGEAPGKNEIIEGKPFVGMAGKTFEKYLNSIGLNRSNIRITNTCFFRPIKISIGKNGKKTIRNRTPKISEVNLFRDILDEEINFVNPKIIVTLGNIPLRRLTTFKSIGNCHGKLYYNENLKTHIFPMYHPSALTYNRNESFKNKYQNDWIKLKEALKKI